jgi:hypothetical protein
MNYTVILSKALFIMITILDGELGFLKIGWRPATLTIREVNASGAKPHKAVVIRPALVVDPVAEDGVIVSHSVCHHVQFSQMHVHSVL